MAEGYEGGDEYGRVQYRRFDRAWCLVVTGALVWWVTRDSETESRS